MKWEIWVSSATGQIVLEDVDSVQNELPTDRIGWTRYERFEAESYEKAKAFLELWRETYDCR